MAKSTSIFKMIGSQSTRLSSPEKAIAYIFDNRKTSINICNEQYLDLDYPIDAWFSHPVQRTEKERQFIHAMLCPYGDSIPNDAMLKELVKGLMDLFYEYPLFSAIHNDYLKSPHIHLLIHPRNISSGKAWQQSRSDLAIQKKKISSLLKELGLYGINNEHLLSDDDLKKKESLSNSPMSTYHTLAILNNDMHSNYLCFEEDSHDLDEDNIIATSPFINDHIIEMPNTFQMMETAFAAMTNNTCNIFSKTSNGIEAIDWSELKEFTYVKRKK